MKDKIIAISMVAIVVAFFTRKYWYYEQGISFVNVNKKKKTFDAVFNWKGQFLIVPSSEWAGSGEYLATDIDSKDRYSFEISEWKGEYQGKILDRQNKHEVVYSAGVSIDYLFGNKK